MDKFSKSDLVNMVAEETGLTKKDVKRTVDTLFEKIGDIVAAGDSVTIQGFCRFFSKEAQARSFRKINSDEIVEVGVRSLPKAKFSKVFVDKVKGE